MPSSQTTYFDIRAPFDFASIIKSPMGMIIGITCLMLFCVNSMPNMEEMQNADNPGQANAPVTGGTQPRKVPVGRG